MPRKLSADVITALCSVAMAVTGAFALYYAYLQISASKKEAQVQHLIELEQQYNQDPMVGYRKKCAQAIVEKGEREPPEEDNLRDFFESVGLLVDRGYLVSQDVWDAFGQDILPLYAHYLQVNGTQANSEYANFVKLGDRMKQIAAQKLGSNGDLTPEQLTQYWRNEAGVGDTTPIHHKRNVALPPKPGH